MNVMLTLIRREFWEHRSLWLTPLAVAGLLVLLAAFGTHASHGAQVAVQLDGREQQFLDALTPDDRSRIFGLQIGLFLVPQLLVMLVTVSFYVLDCLYTERRDRSILFWKSLPVSDTETVAAKFLTAILVVPLLAYGLALVASFVGYLLLTLRFSSTPWAGLAQWNTLVWLRMQALLLADTLVAALWYAPLVALLLVASAWFRKNLYTWVLLLPVGLAYLEYRAFGTGYLVHLLNYRSFGFFGALGLSLPALRGGTGPMPDFEARLNALGLLASPDLWLGVVAAFAFLYLAVRIRRDRDDA